MKLCCPSAQTQSKLSCFSASQLGSHLAGCRISNVAFRRLVCVQSANQLFVFIRKINQSEMEFYER